jgi:RNase H-fold protein (predicted Holliday junction resolvase)
MSATRPARNILGIDPGREKVGLAVVNQDGEILWRKIVPARELGLALREALDSYQPEVLALGGSTASGAARTILDGAGANLKVTVVDEKNSTLEARALYWEANPPSGWRRLVPLSLQAPPEPVDDFAAAVLGRRLLDG